MAEIGRTPDYIVKAKRKSTQEAAKVGAAWNNDDGSISIVLNTFVVLEASNDVMITLFKNDRGTQ